MFDRIAFVVGETVIALGRNLALSFAAITTVAVSLYLLAGMAYVGGRASTYLETVPGRFEMTINLKEGTDLAGIQRTAKYLRLAPGVAHVVWIPRGRRWAKEQAAHPELTEGLENPLPDSMRLRLNDLSKGDAVAATARRMSTVDPVGGVQYFRHAQNAIAQWIPLARRLASWTGSIMLAVAGVLILTAIRLTVESRRVEVRIMRLVGASRIVVGLPFVLEGVLQGTVGGALAVVGLQASQRVVEAKLREMSLGATLAAFPAPLYFGALCAVGGGYGGICSLLALRTPMRAQHRG